MILEATTPADVRTAVSTARDRNLRLAVYATGHGGPAPEGDDTVVVDVSRMTGVLVDPQRRTARVRPGARWADVIAAAAPFGLAPLSGTAPSVGVIGYTLGGGHGWLSRRFGFAADSVLRARLVTADGEPRTVTADRDPDLFWAIRGGGANFGAVTELEFRLYPVRTVHGGTATFPIERAADLLACYRDLAPTLPAELTANIVLGKDSVAIRGVYTGSGTEARRALAPLWRVAGEPVTDGWRTMPFTEIGTVGGTAPRQFTRHATLPDEVLTAAVDAVRGGANAVEVRHWGGAMARPALDAGPIGDRGVPFSVAVDGASATIAGHATGGSFLNWLPDPASAHTAYTSADLAWLRKIKADHDPTNLFGLAKNIAPARHPARLGA